jgi:poly-gamma-glutamate capsule biosynthesis protein CapA/YwtB (metallophosphatase superfamily)
VNRDPRYVRRRRVAGLVGVVVLAVVLGTVRAAWTAWAEPNRLPVTLSFAGDVHFEHQVRDLLRQPGAHEEALRSALSAADFTMVNLETAITERGTAIEGKSFTFRAPASALDYLADLGVDAVAMANNHAADFGDVGLQDTLVARTASRIPLVGIGKDSDEAFAPLSITLRGTSIAILSSSQVTDETSSLYSATASRPGIATNHESNEALVAAVESARTEHDVVIVFMHWGTERDTCPSDAQRGATQALVAAGADAIVGSHAHRVQGSGWMGSTFVGYGLGNFIWDFGHGPNGDSGMLTITIDGNLASKRGKGDESGPVVTAQQWTPMRVGPNGMPAAALGAEQTRLAGEKVLADACSGLSPAPVP